MPERTIEQTAAAVKRPARTPGSAPHAHMRAPAPVWDAAGTHVPGAPSAVLAVQRTAGNLAVMRMLDAQRPDHDLAGPATAVQRLSEDELDDDVEAIRGDELDDDVQRSAAALHEPSDEVIRSAAAEGVRTPATSLPHLDRIQASFGRHSIAHIQAHVGPEAARASRAMNARAYASGNHVVFGATPDLHTAAHEAAHIVQQQAGVQLSGGIGRAGDPYERHADAVADAVVAGRSVEGMLARLGPSPTTGDVNSIVDTPTMATGCASIRQTSAVQRAPRKIPDRLVELLEKSEAEPNEQTWVLKFNNVAFPGKRRSIAEFMIEMALIRGDMPFDELVLYVNAMEGLDGVEYNRRFMKIRNLRMAALEAFLDPQSAYRNKIAEVLMDQRKIVGLPKVSNEDYELLIQHFTPGAQPAGRGTGKSTLEVTTTYPDPTGAPKLSISGRPAFEEEAVNLPGMRKGYHRRHIVAWHTLRAATSNIINYALHMGKSDEVVNLFRKILDETKVEYDKETSLPDLVRSALSKVNSSVRNLWPGGGYQNSVINIYSRILREWAHHVKDMNLDQLVGWYKEEGNIMVKIEKKAKENDPNAGKYRTALISVAEYLDEAIKEMMREGQRAAHVEQYLGKKVNADEKARLIQVLGTAYDPDDVDTTDAQLLFSAALNAQVQSEVEVMKSEYPSAAQTLQTFGAMIADGTEWEEAIQWLKDAPFGEEGFERDNAIERLRSVWDATSQFPAATLLPWQVASAGARMADLLCQAADNFEVDFPFLGDADAMTRFGINDNPQIAEFLNYVKYLLSTADGNVGGEVKDHLTAYKDTLLFFGRATPGMSPSVK